MRLPEKVALLIAVTMLMKVMCSPQNKTADGDFTKHNQKRSLDSPMRVSTVKNIHPHVKDLKARSKKSSDKSNEAIRIMFNFPDVEYPTMLTPTPQYYLQKSYTPQRNQVQQPTGTPSSKTAQYPTSDNTKNMNKKYNPNKLKAIKNPGITKTFHKFGTTTKPNHHGEGEFPDVDYPLTAWETWKPNYWMQNRYYGSDVINNNVPNNYIPIKTDLKPDDFTKKKTLNTAAIPKFKKSNDQYTTPAPIQIDTTTSTTPFITPYTTLYFDTTPSYITMTEDNKDDKPAPKEKVAKKKRKKNKKNKQKGISKPTENNILKDDSTPSHSINTLPEEALYMCNITENLFTVMPDEPISKRNLNKLDKYSNRSNHTNSYIYVATTPSAHIDDSTSTSPFKIHNDDKLLTVSCDNKVASISDTINSVISENTDKVSYFEDSVRNSNKLSAFEVDEEFTTDVFPDFYENILSVSTSTISPTTLLDIDDTWVHSIVIDPYKSEAITDELDQYYIAVP